MPHPGHQGIRAFLEEQGRSGGVRSFLAERGFDEPVQPTSISPDTDPSTFEKLVGAPVRALGGFFVKNLALAGAQGDPALQEQIRQTPFNSPETLQQSSEFLSRITAPGDIQIETLLQGSAIAGAARNPFNPELTQQVREAQPLTQQLRDFEFGDPETGVFGTAGAIQSDFESRPLGVQLGAGLFVPGPEDLALLGVARLGRLGIRGISAATRVSGVAEDAGGGARPVLTELDAIMGRVPQGATQGPREGLVPLLRQSAKNLRLQRGSDQAINAEKTRLSIIAQNLTISARQKASAFFGRQAGELPRERLDLEKSRFFSSEDREILHSTIFQDINSKTDAFFGPNTSRALDKIFDGVTPQKAELRALNQVFGDELTERLLASGLRRFGNSLVDIANIPRAIVTSFDMSAPLRQGLVLLPGHPLRFGQSFFDMGKAFFNEGSARRVEAAIESHDNFSELTQAGLAYTRRRGQGIRLSDREEAFATSFVQKLGQSDNRLLKLFLLPVRASERAYTTFLNKLRFDVANDQLVKWRNLDLDGAEIAARTEQWVRFVNRATGRGGLGLLENAAAPLNAAFFSPRLLASRITLPLSLLEESPEIRKLVAKDLALFTGMVGTTLTLLNMNDGVDVEPNPESSDFGRIKIGPTRVDIMTGFQPIVRYTTQLITNERKSTSTGNFSDLNRLETVGRFLRSKLSPQLAFIVDNLAGEDFLGEEVNPRSHLQRLVPFMIQDITEAVRENGLLGGAVASSAFFGTGVVSYSTPDDASKTMFNDTGFADLPDPFMQDMARELYKASRTKPQTGVFADLDALDVQQQEALNKLSQRIHPSTGRRINRREAVRLYFDIQGNFANTRAGIFRGAFGPREEDRSGFNVSTLIGLFKGGGDSPNEQALSQYYEAQRQAAGELEGVTTGTFDSELWNQLLGQLERTWTKDQRIYVAANTHRRDVPERLLIMLPRRTQRRIRDSLAARKIRLKEFRQGTDIVPTTTDGGIRAFLETQGLGR